MRKSIIAYLLPSLSLIACGKNLSINEFEKIGFLKETQPFFQVIGATDGWKGKFNNSNVEIYIYENKSQIPLNQLKNLPRSGIVCIVENVAIFDHGNGDFCNEATL